MYVHIVIKNYQRRYKLIVTDEKILRQRSKEWHNDSVHAQEELKDVVYQMDEAMEKYEGIGISAIQIGIPWRIFLAGRPSELFINPRIIEKSSIMKQDWEGCLSCPDLKVRVKRSHSVVMEYDTFNESGEYITVKRKFKGFDARVVQHEFDHLNGILITDKGKVVRL
tara:strand:+ start:343 stop:843 length:501 start_codon:yes stop_codon:yes gene_type:complete